MREFEFYEPKSVEKACALLAQFQGKARALAGGTDLMVQLKTGQRDLAALVNLKKIKGLDRLSFTAKAGLRIGALVTWTQLLESEPVAKHYPVLKRASETMGSVQIRNVGTLAGNVCHASPAANGAIPLLVYEAECVIRGPGGERTLPAEKMFAGVQKSALAPGEILTEIRIPPPVPNALAVYYKFALRKALDLATVGLGVLVRAGNGAFDDVRIALGAVAPRPFRAREAEKILSGSPIEDRRIREAAHTAAEECAPITDIRGSKEYRLELVEELTYRAIKEASG